MILSLSQFIFIGCNALVRIGTGWLNAIGQEKKQHKCKVDYIFFECQNECGNTMKEE